MLSLGIKAGFVSESASYELPEILLHFDSLVNHTSHAAKFGFDNNCGAHYEQMRACPKVIIQFSLVLAPPPYCIEPVGKRPCQTTRIPNWGRRGLPFILARKSEGELFRHSVWLNWGRGTLGVFVDLKKCKIAKFMFGFACVSGLSTMIKTIHYDRIIFRGIQYFQISIYV